MLFDSFNKPINYKHLKIDNKKIKDFSYNFTDFYSPDWSEEVFYKGSFEDTVNFIFLINTLNFSFWSDNDKPKWFNIFNGNTYTGSFALFSALNDAVSNGYELFNPKYLKSISRTDLKNILEKYEEMPMFEERLRIISEIGKNLYDNQLNSFFDIYKMSENSAIKLITNIIDIFPTFKDSYIYQDTKYNFLKRAQLVPAMIYSKYQNDTLFNDIDYMTIFADYRVPQTIRKLNLIEYSEELSNKIEKNIYIEEASQEELEIRLSSVQVGLKIKEYVSKDKYINSLHIDYFLWKTGKEILNPDYDFHRTRTIYY